VQVICPTAQVKFLAAEVGDLLFCRHCERCFCAVIASASEAIHRRRGKKEWIASSLCFSQ